tara:strand:+ start:61 stop:747 length:687 start_codon:yes stop_codon:yes gene_type:complete
MFKVSNLSKSFTLHHQEKTQINVLRGISFKVKKGECVALTGPSGAGKSTLMRMLYGNYLATNGSIKIDSLELVGAEPQQILDIRRHHIGYVSQFLQVLPRVSALRVVAEPLIAAGRTSNDAKARAAEILTQLRIPEALWTLSPLTFSGGEQQRVNIARGFSHHYPAMLLDEPTASLDPENRQTVLDLIHEAKTRDTAIIGIFHDQAARDAVCDSEIEINALQQQAVVS